MDFAVPILADCGGNGINVLQDAVRVCYDFVKGMQIGFDNR